VLAWLNPIALAGLAAVAGPIAVHLLRRHRAARRPFPSLRFVLAASTAAVRLRLPSDLWLLALRIGCVSGAAVALAQPVFVTPARRAAWDARISRAIVVDTSSSMAAAAGAAAEAAAAESQGTAAFERIETDTLQQGVLRAVDLLVSMPPSRREIVVISDFQRGSFSAETVQAVPPQYGLRFTVAGPPSGAGEFQGDITLGAPGIEPRAQRIQPSADGTTVSFAPTRGSSEGIRLIDAGSDGDVLLRAVARAGAPSGSAREPLAVAFNSPIAAGKISVTRQNSWILRTLVAMRRDPSLVEAAREHRRAGTGVAGSAIVLARDASGTPVVGAAPDGNELVLIVAATPTDYLSAVTLRSALVARSGTRNWAEHEVGQIPGSQLAAWTREPAPFSTTGVPRDSRMAPGDARLMWIAVLALLALETLVRRKRSTSASPEVIARSGRADAA
jgi:hypothetical protein